MLVDPEVCRVKFDRELERYRAIEETHQARGRWLLSAEFPQVLVVFAAPQLKPPAVVFGALLDFTDYDLMPPSVRLVDPFTRAPYRASQLPTRLMRRVETPAQPGLVIPGMPPGAAAMLIQETHIMQWHDENDVPFLCLPGVREYHEHPAHSGDPWLLHRGGAEGTLYFLLETLYRYGVEPLTDYTVQLVPRIGFLQPSIPT